jgi:hypothetical protein
MEYQGMTGFADILAVVRFPLGGLAVASALALLFSLWSKRQGLSQASGILFLICSAALGVASLAGFGTADRKPAATVSVEGSGHQVVVGDGNTVNGGKR